MATPTVVKIGLDPKRQTQARASMNPETGIKTVNIIEWWNVVWSDKQDNPAANWEAADPAGNTIPSLGDPYRQQTNYAFVTDVLPQLETQSEGNVYRVQVTYQNRTPAGGTQQPAKWDAQTSFRGERFTEAAWYDLNNKAVLNSAGQPFAQQPTQTYYVTTIGFSFKALTFDETTAESLRGMYNTSDVTLTIAALNYKRTFPAGTLLLDDFEASPVVQPAQGTTTQGLAYWNVSLNFKYAPSVKSPIDGSSQSYWTTFVLDQGYCTKDGSTGKPVTIADKNGAYLNSPTYLDGSGNQSTTAHYLQFAFALPADLSPLFAGIA